MSSYFSTEKAPTCWGMYSRLSSVWVCERLRISGLWREEESPVSRMRKQNSCICAQHRVTNWGGRGASGIDPSCSMWLTGYCEHPLTQHRPDVHNVADLLLPKSTQDSIWHYFITVRNGENCTLSNWRRSAGQSLTWTWNESWCQSCQWEENKGRAKNKWTSKERDGNGREKRKAFAHKQGAWVTTAGPHWCRKPTHSTLAYLPHR